MPSVYIEDIFGAMLNKLVVSGYGDALRLMETPTDIVMGHLHYENFQQEFKCQMIETVTDK